MGQELCKALATKDERGARRLDALKRATEAQRRAGVELFHLWGYETFTERLLLNVMARQPLPAPPDQRPPKGTDSEQQQQRRKGEQRGGRRRQQQRSNTRNPHDRKPMRRSNITSADPPHTAPKAIEVQGLQPPADPTGGQDQRRQTCAAPQSARTQAQIARTRRP